MTKTLLNSFKTETTKIEMGCPTTQISQKQHRIRKQHEPNVSGLKKSSIRPTPNSF